MTERMASAKVEDHLGRRYLKETALATCRRKRAHTFGEWLADVAVIEQEELLFAVLRNPASRRLPSALRAGRSRRLGSSDDQDIEQIDLPTVKMLPERII